MTRLRTAWRLSGSNYSLACRITEHSNGHVSVTVIENGRRLDQAVFRGSHGPALHQAWCKAVALHEKYGHRRAPRRPAPDRRYTRSDSAPESDLFAAIRRLKRSRRDVLRALDSLDSDGDRVASAVERFRAAWEQLDLEHHFLTGRPLSAEQYRRTVAIGRPAGRTTGREA